MESFGRRVHEAVTSRGLSLREVAEATGLEIEHVEALERDEFDRLPAEDAVKNGLRSLARLVEVDPDEVLTDYDQERRRWLASAASRRAPRRRRGAALLGTAALVLAVVAFVLWSRPSTGPAETQQSLAPDETPAPAPRVLAEVEAPTTDAPAAPLDSKAATATVEPASVASSLRVPACGVGSGVVEHELVGESGRFAEGERVWFWTLVEDGGAGSSIDHVWIHEGAEVLRVSLSVGGTRWRTQSHKDLPPGAQGHWAVEARDEEGRVLARREFLCAPGRGIPRPTSIERPGPRSN